MQAEDPFAVHLLIHSADKMLIDVAKRTGKELEADWELYIKDEYRGAFFDRHRETYNYFKHAREDFDEDLPVHDIMMSNVMTLFICVANYAKLFSEQTDHMILFQAFVMNINPGIIHANAPGRSTLLEGVLMSQTMTPRDFFKMFEESSHMLPRFYTELGQDCADIKQFYRTSFLSLRAGITPSAATLRVPE